MGQRRSGPSRPALVANAQKATPRCLTTAQRQRYHLSPTLPRWCDTNQKWPFDVVTVAEDHLRAKHYDKAIASFQKAIAFDAGAQNRLAPRLAAAHYGMAWAVFLDVALRGNPTETLREVLADADKAVGLAPEDLLILDTRGQIRLALGDLGKAIVLGLDYIGTRYGRGLAHELKGNSDAAIADFRKTLASKADNDWTKHAQTQARARLRALGVTIETSSTELR